MESFYNLLKIIFFVYLGSFTYITYQILFYYQKKFLFIKTLLFFFLISILLIKASNTYDIPIFHMYIFCYLLGIILAKKYLNTYLYKLNKELSSSLSIFKKPLTNFLKIILLPSFYPFLKNKYKNYIYYKKHPHLKPKTIYELF